MEISPILQNHRLVSHRQHLDHAIDWLQDLVMWSLTRSPTINWYNTSKVGGVLSSMNTVTSRERTHRQVRQMRALCLCVMKGSPQVRLL